MPHTLPDFDALYERIVQRIDINDLVQLLDLLSWDELGVRIFERAIVLASVDLQRSEVHIVRHSQDRLDRSDAAAGATRENLSSMENLSKCPWIKSWATPWFWWEKHPQKPDGLFSLVLKHRSHQEELLEGGEAREGITQLVEPVVVHVQLRQVGEHAEFLWQAPQVVFIYRVELVTQPALRG